MRFWGPILVGSMNLKFKRFISADVAGLSVFCAFYITIGMIFHRSLKKLSDKFESLQNVVFFSALIILGIALMVIVRRYKGNKPVNEITGK
jgi:membrane protein DedA with SNARE-associated domain